MLGRVRTIYGLIGLPPPQLRILNADTPLPRLGFGRRAMMFLTLGGASLGVALPLLWTALDPRARPMDLVALEAAWIGVLLAFAGIALGRGYGRYVATEMALRRFADEHPFYLESSDATYPVFRKLRRALVRNCIETNASKAIRERVETMQPADLLQIWVAVPARALPPALAQLKALSSKFDALLLFQALAFLRNARADAERR